MSPKTVAAVPSRFCAVPRGRADGESLLPSTEPSIVQLTTLVSRLIDVSKYFPTGRPDVARCPASCLLTIRRQSYAGTKPVSGDGLAEDKGAFMTKTKRGSPGSIRDPLVYGYERRGVAVPLSSTPIPRAPPLGRSFVCRLARRRETMSENFYY